MKPENFVAVPEVSLIVLIGRKLLGLIGLGDANYKMRENAVNWLELAERVYQFRRDVLTSAQVGELQARISSLQSLIKSKAGAEKLKLEIEATEEVLRRTGGSIYPKSALIENVEFFLVAAIVILGVRTYFVQPFKIPTNSMWPTYNGMTTEVFTKTADEPSAAAVAGRAVAYGAWPHRLDAPIDGEVMIPIVGGQSRGYVYNRTVRGRTWLVIPTDLREYCIFVGDQPVRFKLPLDFDFNWVLSKAFIAPGKPYDNQLIYDQIGEFARVHGVVSGHIDEVVDGRLQKIPVTFVRTGIQARKGQRILSFDELTGDQLFVDRVSYHFVPPSVGDGFVFRTDNIHSVYMQDANGNPLEQYYIKRLVGVPGDELEITRGKTTSDGNLKIGVSSGGVLLRNGKPIEGSKAFSSNAEQKDGYRGYQQIHSLDAGGKVKVPPGSFLALGDNSFNSQDGRYWGFVPGKDVAGRPMFIYFPFTKHWGPAP